MLMTIKTLRVKNFIGCRSAEIQLGNLTFVWGPNGSGKTSLADALRFALTGEAARGCTQGELVTSGENSAEIELQERIKTDRDHVAKKLGIEATLIANRSVLAQLARHPRKIDDLLLPWQAGLLRDAPSLKSA